MAKALIVSAGNNANEYLARHIGELGYTRPTIVASGGGVASARGWRRSAPPHGYQRL